MSMLHWAAPSASPSKRRHHLLLISHQTLVGAELLPFCGAPGGSPSIVLHTIYKWCAADMMASSRISQDGLAELNDRIHLILI